MKKVPEVGSLIVTSHLIFVYPDVHANVGCQTLDPGTLVVVLSLPGTSSDHDLLWCLTPDGPFFIRARALGLGVLA